MKYLITSNEKIKLKFQTICFSAFLADQSEAKDVFIPADKFLIKKRCISVLHLNLLPFVQLAHNVVVRIIYCCRLTETIFESSNKGINIGRHA